MIFSGIYRYFRLPWVIRMLIFEKGNRKSRVKNDLKHDVQNDVTSLNTKKCTPTFQAIGYKRMMQPTQLIFQGQWTHKMSRYSFPVDHRSLDDLCTSTYAMSQKLLARYTLGERYLYFERNVEKFGVRVIR